MKVNDDVDRYGRAFFEDVRSTADPAARRMVPYLIEHTAASSVVDFGCGDGTWLAVFAEHRLEILGIDGHHVDGSMLQIPSDSFRAMDLREPRMIDRRFDLATCFEVAEHLPADAGPGLVASLVAAADVVAFGAAVPGQPGTGHINCRWQSYWAGLFANHGYEPDTGIRSVFWTDPQVSYWYAQNVALYRRNGPPMLDGPLDVVHPRMLEAVQELHASAEQALRQRQPGLREQITGLPAALRASLGRRRPSAATKSAPPDA